LTRPLSSIFFRSGVRVPGIQEELLAQVSDPKLPVLPENHQSDVLGIGQAERLQIGRILLDHLAAGRVEREAELVIQTEGLILLLIVRTDFLLFLAFSISSSAI
jgi:hypothetical protein